MGTQEPNPVSLEDDLYSLAGFLLCQRWHQDQADELVEKWSGSIQELATSRADALHTRRRRRAVNNSAPEQPSRSTPSSRTVSGSSAATSESSSRTIIAISTPVVRRRDTAIRTPGPDLIAPAPSSVPELAVEAGPSSPTQPVSTHPPRHGTHFYALSSERSSTSTRSSSTTSDRYVTASGPSASASRPSTPVSGPPTTAPEASSQSANVAFDPAVGSRATAPQGPSPSPMPFVADAGPQPCIGAGSRPSAEAAPNAQACRCGHVPLLPIDDLCGICKDEIKPEDALVRCKKQCGRQLHEDCMEGWMAYQVSNARRPNCIHCRADWILERCECEG